VRKIYRVTVAAVNYDDEGNFVSLLRFAPSEVDDALRIVANVPPPTALTQGMSPSAAATVKRMVADGEAIAAEIDRKLHETEAAPVVETPRRKRRTRAEIEADRIREAATTDPQRAVKDALAAGAPVELPDVPQVGSEPTAVHPATEAPDVPQAVDEPLPAHEHAESADSTPAAPWNPFQTR